MKTLRKHIEELQRAEDVLGGDTPILHSPLGWATDREGNSYAQPRLSVVVVSNVTLYEGDAHGDDGHNVCLVVSP